MVTLRSYSAMSFFLRKDFLKHQLLEPAIDRESGSNGEGNEGPVDTVLPCSGVGRASDAPAPPLVVLCEASLKTRGCYFCAPQLKVFHRTLVATHSRDGPQKGRS